MGRQIFVDIDDLIFIESRGSRIAKRSLRFRYDTFEELDFVFVRDGTLVELATGTALQFIIKEDGVYDGPVIAGIPYAGFSKVGTGENTVYRGYLDTTADTIAENLGVDSDDENDVPSFDCHAELLMVTAGRKSYVEIVPAVISNVLSRDGDEVPTEVPSSGIFLTTEDINVLVAGLVGGKIPPELLPTTPTITTVRVVADEAARLALEDVTEGTAVLQLDEPSNLYILVDAETPEDEESWEVVGVITILRSQITDFAHASTHAAGGGDPIKLDDLAVPDDNTDLDASAARHGLLPKLSGVVSNFLNGLGQWVDIDGIVGGFPFWHNVQNRPGILVEIGSIVGSSNDDIIQKKFGAWVNRSLANLATDMGKAAPNGLCPLDSGAKVPVAFLPSSVMEYKGTWNAATNTPALADGTGNVGDLYRVATGGTRNLGSGNITFYVSDQVIFNGSTWERSATSSAVSSVAGRTGDVTLDKNDVGLGDVDNTPDLDKPISTATQTALDGKQNYTKPVVAIGGTSYTPTPGESGKVLHFTSSSAVTVTLNAGTAGVAFDAIRGGTGSVTFAAGAGVTILCVGPNKRISATGGGVTVTYLSSTLVSVEGRVE
jgi:hypothetical protein